MRQRFRISNGEWVCGECGAAMVEATDDDGGVIMTHAGGCGLGMAGAGASS